MSTPPEFTVDVDQNPYLAEGAVRVDAIVSVTAAGESAPGGTASSGPPSSGTAPVEALEMIVVDVSGSMQGDRIVAARQATVAAVDALRDGVLFTVIAGDARARQVYPASGAVRAAADTRAAAARAVRSLRASGGTRFAEWIGLARQVAEQYPHAIRHAVLLTDGQNGDKVGVLERALMSCSGVFSCDCRGVGTDWRVDEVRLIASALLGSVDIVARPQDLAADFGAIMNASMDKRVADVALRLWTPRGAQVRFVKQVAPAVEDLTGRRTDSGPLRGDYPLGAWGAETREYHVCVEVAPQAVGAEMLAGRAMVVRAGSDDVLAQGLVRAIWTDDEGLATGISRRVAHYTGQAELSSAIQEGLAARKAGDAPTTTARLGRAVALAAESGNDDTARLLERVVDVVDAPSGTVRLRATVDDADEMTLDIRSVRTSRVRGEG